MDEALQELGETIAAALDNEITAFSVSHGELTVLTRPSCVTKVLKFLRDDAQCQFKQLVDVCGAYHLLSLTHNQRIRVKLYTDEDTPVPSAIDIYSTAGWFERETWDLYGVMFTGHPDMRRILTDYGFQGFPLRKDFPLTGYVEVRYSEEQKRVVYEPVSLVQDFRSFDFMSPWEGAEYILPGDEKAPEETASKEKAS